MKLSASSPLRSVLDSLLYSYAQILFCNRRWMGLLLLAVTFFHPASGILGLIGGILANLIAHALKFDSDRIRSGFYGFNGILFGVAYGFYFAPTPFLLILFVIFIAITFLIAAVLEHYLAVAFNLPGLSLPFVISLFVTLVFFRNYESFTLSWPPVTPVAGLPWFTVEVQRYGQALALLFYQPNVLAGLVMAAGLLVFSRTVFVLSIASFAAAEAAVAALLPGQSETFVIVAALNAMLVGIALGGSLVIPSRKSLALAVIGAVLSVILTGFFTQVCHSVRLPVVVLPFNFLVLTTLYSLKFRQKTSELVLLYFRPGSPEENYYYHHTTQARFDRLKYQMAELPVSGEWTISQGHNGIATHRAAWKHAWDFVITDEKGKTYQSGGRDLEDFYCYRLPVCAPLDGEVVTVADSVPNNKVGDVNLARNWGNTIVLKHAEDLFSSLSHLEPGSARVAAGSQVKQGEVLALCGSSGRSPEPHVHFQFQTGGKIGDHTFEHPLGYFIERQNDALLLRVSEIPGEGARVQNLTLHRALEDALCLTLGTQLKWRWTFDDHPEVVEEWEVKADAYNSLYLESSAGAWVTLFFNKRMFYLTAFRGNMKSALYYFYLCATQIPLGFADGLTWQDVLPLSKMLHSPARILSEFWLLFGSSLTADVQFSFFESQNHDARIGVRSRHRIHGRGLLSRVQRSAEGSLYFGLDGGIESYEFHDDRRRMFHVKRVAESDRSLDEIPPDGRRQN